MLWDIKSHILDVEKTLDTLKSSQKIQPELVKCKVEESKPPEKTTQLKCIDKKLDVLIAKSNEHKILKYIPLPDFMSRDDFSDLISFLNIAAFFVAGYEIRQAHRSNQQQKEAVRKSKSSSYALQQNVEEQKGIIRGNRTRALIGDRKTSWPERKGDLVRARTTRASTGESDLNRAARIGDFPEMYYYIADRIQNTQGPVIITMPFYLFGILGSPHGLNNFHHTLHELFGNAAAGNDKRQLIVITYEDNYRCLLALTRYSHAIHAIETLDDTPQSQKLEKIFSKKVWEAFLVEMQKFREALDEHPRNREILENLAKEYEEFLIKAEEGAIASKGSADEVKNASAEDMDKAFLAHLKVRPMLPQKGWRRFVPGLNGLLRDKEIMLFDALHNARTAFSQAVEAQEKIYSIKEAEWNGTETPWPQGATIAKLSHEKLKKIGKTYDNVMTVYTGGEVISATSSLDPSHNARKNRLMSESGEKAIDYHEQQLSDLFEIAGREQFSPETIKLLKRILPNIRAIKNWPVPTAPQV